MTQAVILVNPNDTCHSGYTYMHVEHHHWFIDNGGLNTALMWLTLECYPLRKQQRNKISYINFFSRQNTAHNYWNRIKMIKPSRDPFPRKISTNTEGLRDKSRPRKPIRDLWNFSLALKLSCWDLRQKYIQTYTQELHRLDAFHQRPQVKHFNMHADVTWNIQCRTKIPRAYRVWHSTGLSWNDLKW